MDSPKNDYVNLFDNPMIREARRALTPEQIKNYELIGEELHSIDFEKSTYEIPSVEEVLKHEIEELVKAGFPIEELSEEERMLYRPSKEPI